MLIRADLGAETATTITGRSAPAATTARSPTTRSRRCSPTEIAKVLAPVARPLAIDPALKPHVILVVGVNGTGKTTTIGKLAAKLRDEGKSVVLAAGDTFRAAAIEQLKIWGERTGAHGRCRRAPAPTPPASPSTRSNEARDGRRRRPAHRHRRPAAEQGRADGRAGEDHPRHPQARPDAPHTVLLTLDATTGQNARQPGRDLRHAAPASPASS